MKHIRLLWDFLFGVLLIGGAPWAVLGLTVVLGDLCQSQFHVVIPELIFGIMLLAAIAAFCFAISYRVFHRLLPKPFIVLEIILGMAGAIFFFGLYGVVSYSAYGI
jgi:hypothetical protein